MMRGRIKIGSKIFQDFACMSWPNCKAPRGSSNPNKADDPNMIFDMKFDGGRVVCTASGFGDLSRGGNYGNGKIYVFAAAIQQAKEQ